MIPNQENIAIITQAVKTTFRDVLLTGAASDWMKVASETPSTTGTEFMPFLGDFPEITELVGERVAKQVALHGYSLRNKTWTGTAYVDRADIEDDTWGGGLDMRTRSMGEAVKSFRDIQIFGTLLPQCFSLTCYDGTPMVGANHPKFKGGYDSNIIALTPAWGAATFALGAEVTAADGSVWAVTTRGNGVSTTIPSGPGPTFVDGQITWTRNNPWFLLDTSRILKPFIWQKRIAPQIEIQSQPNGEGMFWQDKIYFGSRERGMYGNAMWQQVVASYEDLNAANFNAAYQLIQSRTHPDSGRKLGLKPTILTVGPTNRNSANTVVQVERLANGASNPNWKIVEILNTSWLN